MSSTNSNPHATIATRSVQLPPAPVLIGVTYAVCVWGLIALLGAEILFTDVDPHASEGPIASMTPSLLGSSVGGAGPGQKFPSQLLEHVDVEGLVGDQLRQPGVLRLKLPEALRLGGRHPAVLGSPPVPGRLGDLQCPQDSGQVAPLSRVVSPSASLRTTCSRVCR